MNDLLSFGIHHWREGIREFKKEQAEEERKEGNLMRVLLRMASQKTWLAWEPWCGEVRRNRVAKKVALKWIQRTICAAWRTGKTRMRVKALKVAHRIIYATLVQSLELWKDKTAEEKRMRAKTFKVVQRMIRYWRYGEIGQQRRSR